MGDPLNDALWATACSLPSFADDDYAHWLAQYATLTERQRDDLARRVDALEAPPRVSICLGYMGGADNGTLLARSIAALDAQIDASAETVIACRPADSGKARRLSGRATRSVFSVVEVDEGEIELSVLENAAWQAAEGDFVGFLGVGDLLAWNAVAEVRLRLAQKPDVSIVTVDEDWVDERGARCKPRFRTAWDSDAQLGFDHMGRFSPVRRQLLKSLGGLDPSCGLAAHYDLHCRAAEHAGLLGMTSIPLVLRHAAVPLSVNQSAAEIYAKAARDVARRSAERIEGVACSIEPSPIAPLVHRVRWPLPAVPPRVSIMVPTRDKADLVRVVAEGVLQGTDYADLELLVLDNGSIEPETTALFESLVSDPRVKIIPLPGPFNFSKLNNDGLRAATGDVILLLNNDVEIISSGWLREMVSLAIRPDVGCVGAKLLYGDGRIQHAGVSFAEQTGCAHVGRLMERGSAGVNGDMAITRCYAAVTAACLAIRRSVIDEIGGFDQDAFKVGYNDVDLCLRAGDHGYKCLLTPFAELFHLESVSRGPNDNILKRSQELVEQARAAGRWRDIFIGDPFQSPNTLRTWDSDAKLIEPRQPWPAAF